MARHISPLASQAREIISHKYYRETDGTKAKLEEILVLEKRKAQNRIPYFFSCSKQYAGKFMLGKHHCIQLFHISCIQMVMSIVSFRHAYR